MLRSIGSSFQKGEQTPSLIFSLLPLVAGTHPVCVTCEISATAFRSCVSASAQPRTHMKPSRPENACEQRKYLQIVKKTHTETDKETHYGREGTRGREREGERERERWISSGLLLHHRCAQILWPPHSLSCGGERCISIPPWLITLPYLSFPQICACEGSRSC